LPLLILILLLILVLVFLLILLLVLTLTYPSTHLFPIIYRSLSPPPYSHTLTHTHTHTHTHSLSLSLSLFSGGLVLYAFKVMVDTDILLENARNGYMDVVGSACNTMMNILHLLIRVVKLLGDRERNKKRRN
jgi:hypothetical protein